MSPASHISRQGAPIWRRLDCLKASRRREYLKAYTTALKGTAFKTALHRRIAGTGYRVRKDTDGAQHCLSPSPQCSAGNSSMDQHEWP